MLVSTNRVSSVGTPASARRQSFLPADVIVAAQHERDVDSKPYRDFVLTASPLAWVPEARRRRRTTVSRKAASQAAREGTWDAVQPTRTPNSEGCEPRASGRLPFSGRQCSRGRPRGTRVDPSCGDLIGNRNSKMKAQHQRRTESGEVIAQPVWHGQRRLAALNGYARIARIARCRQSTHAAASTLSIWPRISPSS
jgi:hypothetical protein